MGLYYFGRSFSVHEGYKPVSGNPNPDRFNIMDWKQVGLHLVLLVKYPDAMNYEGKKIMLFLNTKYEDVARLRTLDPHFSSNRNVVSPFARFEPTGEGWRAAVLLAGIL